MDNYYIKYTFNDGTTIESKNYPYQVIARGDVQYAIDRGGIWWKDRFFPISDLHYADILIRKVEK